MLLRANTPQAVVEDSGSTNVRGIRVIVQQDGHATVEEHNGDKHEIKLNEQLCHRLIEEIKEVGPLDNIPAGHCMKSASFGSRITVEFNGAKSPDLTCPGVSDAHLEALQKDAREVLNAARDATGIRGRRIFIPPPR